MDRAQREGPNACCHAERRAALVGWLCLTAMVDSPNFRLELSQLTPNAPFALVLSDNQATLPLLNVTLHVDPTNVFVVSGVANPAWFTVLAAVLTSWRAVLANPVPMAVWAAVVTALMLVGFATLMLGLIVVVPVIGHARWHAYRDLVVTEAGR